MNIELVCYFCGREESDRIVWYSKGRPDFPKYSLEQPALCCKSCFVNAKAGKLYQYPFLRINYNSGTSGNWGCLTFSNLIKLDNKTFASKYLSNVCYEPNHLRQKGWRKKLWHIRYVSLGNEKKRKRELSYGVVH